MSTSYEQVARVADEMRHAGQSTSVRAVYARVGGDYTLVQRHMRTWRNQEVPTTGVGAAQLSEAVQNALRLEVAQQRRAAVLTASAELQETAEEVEDLSRENGRLSAELAVTTTSLRQAELNHERLATEAAQLRVEALRLQERLAEALAAADRARVDLAQGQLQAASDAALIEALRGDVESRRVEIEREREGRTASDRTAIAATAARDAQEGRVSDLIGRVQALEDERTALQECVDAERARRHSLERDHDVALERAAAALARAEDLADRERQLRTRAFGG